VESEGSCRQSAGPTNRKRIEAAQWGKQANRCEAQFLHGTLRRRSDGHKRDGECVIPGEICIAAMSNEHRKVLKRAMQKSAEAIVVLRERNEGLNLSRVDRGPSLELVGQKPRKRACDMR
jgi:hypothetical protein